MASHRPAERGFTLVEMIVALALLALISLAALAMVNSVIATRTRTAQRLDRLADLQRALTILDGDLTQLAPGPIAFDARGLGFSRWAGSAMGTARIGYSVHDGMIERTIDGRSQRLLSDVAGVRLGFYVAGSGWAPNWPPRPDLRDAWPAAIALDIALVPRPGQPTGTIRRVIELPARP